jgi:hypothetical protein
MRIKKKANFRLITMLMSVILISLSFVAPICQCLTINNDNNNPSIYTSNGEDFTIMLHRLKLEDEIDPLKGSAEWTLKMYVNDIKQTYEFSCEDCTIDQTFTWGGIITEGMKLVEIKMELLERDLGYWPDEHDIADISAYIDENYEEEDYDDTTDFENNRPAVFIRSYNLFVNEWIEENQNNDYLKEEMHSGLNWFVTSGNFDGSTSIDENDVSIWFNISVGNTPPYTPEKPIGQTVGWIGEVYAYSTESYDPDGDPIQFGWDWDGDGVIDEFTDFCNSWETVTSLNIWIRARIFLVRVIAVDSKGLTSGWSDPLGVEINGPTGKTGAEVEDWSLGRIYTYYLDHYDTQNIIEIMRGGGNIVTAVAAIISVIAISCGIPLDISTAITIVTALLRIGVEVLNLMDRGMGIYIKAYVVFLGDFPTNAIGYAWSQSMRGDEDGIIPADNVAPFKPDIPLGPDQGSPNKELIFTASTTDQNNDDISYLFEWGDGLYNWSDFAESGETASLSHIFENKGAYCIRVKAIDCYGYESEWSDPLTLTVNTDKSSEYQKISLIQRLLSFFNFPVYSQFFN